MPVLQDIDDLVQEVRDILDSGDEVWIPLTGSATFAAGSQKTEDIILNIPQDGDYFMSRLNLFLGSRLLNTASPELSDRTYRPNDAWSINQTAPGNNPPQFDFNYELILPSGKYQNAPLPGGFAFSNRYAVPNRTTGGGQVMPYSGWVAGQLMVGECPLPAGSAITVRVTPIYNLPSTVAGYEREFRITAVSTGCKRVRAFI